MPEPLVEGDRLAGPRALVENVRDERSADGAAGMNPIELCWSKLKGLLREFGARTRDALDVAIQRAMDLIDRHDAAGWSDDRRDWDGERVTIGDR